MSEAKDLGAPAARPLTDTDLDSLEKLLSKASQGPWTFWRDFIEEENAALCAAIRNLAPGLIAELRASRAWRREAEGLLVEARTLINEIACFVSLQAARNPNPFNQDTLARINAFLDKQQGTAP